MAAEKPKLTFVTGNKKKLEEVKLYLAGAGACVSPTQNLVNLFLIKLVRISGFSSLFSAIAVLLALSGKMCLKNTAIAEKRKENPESLTNLVRKRLTRKYPQYRWEFHGQL